MQKIFFSGKRFFCRVTRNLASQKKKKDLRITSRKIILSVIIVITICILILSAKRKSAHHFLFLAPHLFLCASVDPNPGPYERGSLGDILPITSRYGLPPRTTRFRPQLEVGHQPHARCFGHGGGCHRGPPRRF
jgi:hypothetical protein